MAKTPNSPRRRDRKFVAEQLLLTADLLELLREQDEQAERHRQAASMLRSAPEMAGTLPSAAELEQMEDLCPVAYADTVQLLRTGSTASLEIHLAEVPGPVLAMLRLHGLGAKRLRHVWKNMGICDAATLYRAVRENRLLRERGFGPKTQAKVLQSLQLARLQGSDFLLADLRLPASILEQELRETLGADARVDATGPYRRGCTQLDGIDLLLHADHYKEVMIFLVRHEGYELMTASSDSILARFRDTNVPIRLHFRSHNYYLELFRLSGSAEHLAAIPISQGRKYRNEAEIYAQAGLPYLPAALRESHDELRIAHKQGVPKLVHHTDIRGLLHAHSTYSDGASTLLELAQHCQSMGMQYLGISDHGPGHPDGAGMTPEDILAQHKEIDRLNLQLAPFRILKGIELDILPDGSLPLPIAVLATFDFVIASLHEKEVLNVAEATMRLVRAARHPYVTMLGHVGGRTAMGTFSQPTNLELLFDICAQEGVAVEINCCPTRLDLDWEAVRLAVERKLMVSISPNAHSASALHDYENGISIGRKGLLTAPLTLNALPLPQLSALLAKKRGVKVG